MVESQTKNVMNNIPIVKFQESTKSGHEKLAFSFFTGIAKYTADPKVINEINEVIVFQIKNASRVGEMKIRIKIEPRF